MGRQTLNSFFLDEGMMDVILDAFDCDKEWLNRFKAVDLKDNESCSLFFEKLQKEYWEICKKYSGAKEELNSDSNGGITYEEKRKQLARKILGLAKKMGELEGTIFATISIYLCHEKCVPMEFVGKLENNIMDQIWEVPLFWNIQSKLKDFICCYSIWKKKKAFDFSEMEQANREIMDDSDETEDADIGMFSDSSFFLN